MIARSRIALAALLVGVASACLPFPRWTYTAQTRVEVSPGSDRFSADALLRAGLVAADVASAVGMKSGDEVWGGIESAQTLSSWKVPPRRLLGLWSRKQSFSLPIDLLLEVSEDGRVLWFSVSDHENGSPSPEVARITARLRERVEADFPSEAIAHESKRSGPIFDHP